MAEISEPGRARVPRWRVALGVAVIAACAAFLWAIHGVVAAPSAYPVAARGEEIAGWAMILIGLAWGCFALFARAVEGNRPASRVRAAVQWEQDSLSVLCLLLGVMLVPTNLSEIVWLIDHRVWLKVLAVIPFPLITLYGFVQGLQGLIRDWRYR